MVNALHLKWRDRLVPDEFDPRRWNNQWPYFTYLSTEHKLVQRLFSPGIL